MSYTKGPWHHYDDTGDNKTNRHEIVAFGKTICHIYASVPHEDAANASLITAAPELLAALKGVLALIESGQLVRNTSGDANPDWAMRQVPFVMALKAAQDAIEKAEGLSAVTPEDICSRCGCSLVHIAGLGLRVVLCPVCDADSSAFDEEVAR